MLFVLFFFFWQSMAAPVFFFFFEDPILLFFCTRRKGDFTDSFLLTHVKAKTSLYMYWCIYSHRRTRKSSKSWSLSCRLFTGCVHTRRVIERFNSVWALFLTYILILGGKERVREEISTPSWSLLCSKGVWFLRKGKKREKRWIQTTERIRRNNNRDIDFPFL
jgi:hypothetical protein